MCPHQYGQWEEGEGGPVGGLMGVGVVGYAGKACTVRLVMPKGGGPICEVAGISPGSC